MEAQALKEGKEIPKLSLPVAKISMMTNSPRLSAKHSEINLQSPSGCLLRANTLAE